MNFGEKQSFDKVLYTGFATVKVVGVNPDKEALGKIYGKPMSEDMKEPVYEGKTAQGDEYCELVFYVKTLGEHEVINTVRIKLIDKEVSTTKDGITKYQYVNQVGGQSWVENENSLLKKFTHLIESKTGNVVCELTHRRAIQGEANLYAFLQAWLDAGVPFFGKAAKDTDILIDKKRIFRNLDKYVKDTLAPLVGGERTGSFGTLWLVGQQEKDGNVKQFQNIHNEYWAPWKFKNFTNAINTGKWEGDQLQKTYKYLTDSLNKRNAQYSLGWLKQLDGSVPFEVVENSTNSSNDQVVDDLNF